MDDSRAYYVRYYVENIVVFRVASSQFDENNDADVVSQLLRHPLPATRQRILVVRMCTYTYSRL